MQAMTSVHNTQLGGGIVTSPTLAPIKLESLGSGISDSLYDLVPSSQHHSILSSHHSHHPDSTHISHGRETGGLMPTGATSVVHSAGVQPPQTAGRLTVLTGGRHHEPPQPPQQAPSPTRGKLIPSNYT